MDDDGWDRLPDTVWRGPRLSSSLHRELFAALRRAIDQDLTALQRRVFVAIALNEVPMDAFARELGAKPQCRSTRRCSMLGASSGRVCSAAGYEPPYVRTGHL